MESLNLHPAWRQAIRQYIAEGKQPGDTLTHTWLYEAFSLSPLTPETLQVDAAKTQLAFLGQFKRFEDELLHEHQTALRVVRGVGYKILPPKEQTRYGYERGMREIKKGLKRAVVTVSNVNLSMLTVDERRENADTIAKLASLRGMVKSTELQARVTDAIGFQASPEDG